MEMVFRTRSMPAAAFAVARGASLPRVEPTDDPRHFELIFSDHNGTVASAVEDFFRGNAVAARDFYRALQDIRFHINRAKAGVRKVVANG